MRHLIAVVSLTLALAGCATPLSPVSTAEAGTAPIYAPVAIRIPAIGASSSLIALGFDAQGGMAVAPLDQPGQATYFLDGDSGVLPGEDGPALVAGHRSGRVDGVSVPGVFARLDELAPGDEVFTTDTEGQTLRWLVQRLAVYPKDALDWAEVAGDTDGPALRIITCDGLLRDNGQGGSTYTDNIVVFAHPAE